MAPDRGFRGAPPPYRDTDEPDIADEALPEHSDGNDLTQDAISKREAAERILATRAADPTNFTLRGIIAGLLIGVIINFSNIYFGLQTGWISGMSMPSALIAFGAFKAMSPYLKVQFSPVENVLVQSVASSVGTMPLGCGFVGVIPALEYLLKPEENGPLHLTYWKLALWAVGICLFGVVFAVPLRKQVIIKEKLKFPTGSATALMIGVLHGDKSDATLVHQDEARDDRQGRESESSERLRPGASQAEMLESLNPNPARGGSIDWKGKIKLLIVAFCSSAAYVGHVLCVCSFEHKAYHSIDHLRLLRPSGPRHTCPRHHSELRLAMEPQSFTCLCWSGHHHGPSYDDSHALGCRSRLGHPLPSSEAQGLGSRTRQRLEQR